MTEPVMDSSDYAELESGYSLIKSEDIEESIEEKNGYGMSREEELMISNIKEEEEEGGERQSEEVLREDGVKTEEICTFEWGHEELDEPFSKSNQTERWLSEKGIPEEEEGSLPPAEFEVFVCSLCPFIDMAEEKLHQHIEKVHPEEHIRILGYVGNAAENPGPPGSSHQHPTTSETLLSPTQPHTAGQPSLIGAPRALKTALTSRGMDSARLLKIPSGTVMPLTAAERQRKRRQRLRAEGNYDDYCKRQNEIKRKSRDAQKAREQMLPMSEQIKLVMERRELVKKRVIKHRALKRARAKMTPVGKASPAFNSPCALGKANLKAKRALQHPLPQTPKRKKAVIKIEGDASQSPEKDQATKRPVAALSEETIEAVRLLFARDNISRQAPAGKNVTTV